MGISCLAFSLINFDYDLIDWEFIILGIITVLLSLKLTVTLSISKSAISFADAMVFLLLLMYGGEVTIVWVSLVVFITCLHLKSQGFKINKLAIFFNIASSIIITAISYLVLITIPHLLNIGFDLTNNTNLILVLCILAVSQFLTTSISAAIYQTLQFKENFISYWKRVCISGSITQMIGAAIAGVIYKFIYAGDLVMIGLVSIIIITAFYYYRYSINEINQAMEESQKAQTETAKAEVARRKEAERYAEELANSLAKEELISKALRQSKKELERAASYDFLTDLPNRTYLIQYLREISENAKKNQKKYFVFSLDLNRFKNVNDRLGHTVGDRLLKLVGKRLQRLLNENDKVARLGSDEFAIILDSIDNIEQAKEIGEKIYKKLTEPFFIQGHHIFSDLTIGIAPLDETHKRLEYILRDADVAIHHAKENGLGVAVFTKELRDGFLEKINLEADLRFSIDREELSLHYQPIISLCDGELIGFEALLRWNHGKKGFISPAKFIPIAENSGLIIPITQWILRETCIQINKWKNLSYSHNKLFVSVNISGKHLADNSLISDINNALKISGLSPLSLKLEITESIAMENAGQTVKILTQLKELGVFMSIDDFGTGYSSLNHLHRLPFDTLKIDRFFVNEIGENGENTEILKTILSLAKNLSMRVVAEGIETETQLGVLNELGCDYGQGYLMSKPKPSEEIERSLLMEENSWKPLFENTNRILRFEENLRETNLRIN